MFDFDALYNLLSKVWPEKYAYVEVTPLRAFLAVVIIGWVIWEWQQWNKHR